VQPADAHAQGGPAQNPSSKIHDVNSDRPARDPTGKDTGRRIQEQKPKIQNGKRPYQKTPARETAFLANFKKALAVPKEKRYRWSEKRYAANLNNLEMAWSARRGRATLTETDTGETPVLRIDAGDPGSQHDAQPTSEQHHSAGFEPRESRSERKTPSQGKVRASNGGCSEPQPSETRSATLHREDCCYFRRPSAVQVEKQKLREGLASLFPAYPANQDQDTGPAVAGVGARDSGLGTREFNRVSTIGQNNPDLKQASSAPLLQRAAEQIWKRRQHFSRQARREARQVMRLLSGAAQSSSPLGEEEALKLFDRLLEIFIRSRAVPLAQLLTGQVERALWEMVEARYGPKVYVNNKSYTLLCQVLDDDYRWGLEQEKLRREERRAAAGESQESGNRDQGTTQGTGNPEQRVAQGSQSNPAAFANPESPTPNPSENEAPQGEPAAGRPCQPPPLPPTFEEFLDLCYRAFAPPSPVRDLAQDRALIIQVAHSVWMRLHVYDRQVQQESEMLGAVFETAAQAVTGYQDLQQRAFALKAAFGIHPSPNGDLSELTAILEKDVRQVQQWRRKNRVPSNA
jgi:hypothetical protein